MKIKNNKVIIYRFFLLFVKITVMTLCLTILGFFYGCKANQSGSEHELYLSALDSYSEKDFPSTVELCESILKKDNNLFQAELLRIKALFFLNEYGEAEKSIKILVKKVPEYTDARLWFIRLLILQEKFDEVAPLLEKELALNETDWRIHYLKGIVDSKNENYSGQLVSLQQAERALSDGAKVYLDLTKLWLVLGMEEQAKKYLEQARLLVPDHGELRVLFETLETLTQKKEEKNG